MNPKLPKHCRAVLFVAASLLLHFPGFSQLSGVTNVCPGSDAQAYSVVPVPGATGYQWTITPSSLGLIVSGQGTDAVEITWNSPGVAQLCATPSTGTGPGASQCVMIISTPIPPQTETYQTCIGVPVECQGNMYDFPGVYPNVYSSWLGCDSVINCNIQWLPTQPPTQVEQTVNAPDCVTMNGEDYCETGVYQIVFQDVNGCDSVVILDLTVNPLLVLPEIQEEISPGGDWLRSYSVPENVHVVSYVWTLSEGAILLEGQGTERIEVDWSEAVMGKDTWTESPSREVCLWAEDAYGNTDETCLTALVTSVQELPSTVQARLFPNPVTDVFQLEWSEGLGEDAHLLLHRVDGQLLRSWELAAGIRQQEFSVEGLSGGLYFWTLKEQGHRVQGGKLLVR